VETSCAQIIREFDLIEEIWQLAYSQNSILLNLGVIESCVFILSTEFVLSVKWKCQMGQIKNIMPGLL